MTSSQLVKILLRLPDINLSLQGVIFSPPIPELNFDLSASLQDFPNLSIPSAPSHLKALLYEHPDIPSFEYLEPITKKSDLCFLALFSDHSQDFGQIFVLARNDDTQGLGQFFTGARFALFSYHYSELVGSLAEDLASFIKLQKKAKSDLIKTSQKKYSEIEDLKDLKKHFEDMAEYLSSRSSRLKEELETSKQAVSQLKSQLDKKRSHLREKESFVMICVICKSQKKEIVFVPCGHIVLCQACLIETLEISPGVIRNKSVKCPLCNTQSRETQLVYFA